MLWSSDLLYIFVWERSIQTSALLYYHWLNFLNVPLEARRNLCFCFTLIVEVLLLSADWRLVQWNSESIYWLMSNKTTLLLSRWWSIEATLLLPWRRYVRSYYLCSLQEVCLEGSGRVFVLDLVTIYGRLCDFFGWNVPPHDCVVWKLSLWDSVRKQLIDDRWLIFSLCRIHLFAIYDCIKNIPEHALLLLFTFKKLAVSWTKVLLPLLSVLCQKPHKLWALGSHTILIKLDWMP